MSIPSAAQIAAIVSRVENIEREIAERNEDKSEIYKEAKGNGFNTHVIKAIVARRRKDQDKIAEFDAVFDLYMAALDGTEYATRVQEAAE